MCGISVVINGTDDQIRLMSQAQQRRGKSSHFFEDITDTKSIRVAFEYLPITDCNTPAPFISGQYHVWLNGFISNYRELADLHNISMQTNCDGELLAKLYEKLGQECIPLLNGFFSIVVYDIFDIHIYTDRYGIKQMYRYNDGKTTFFASEVKAILAVASPNLDGKAIADWKYSLGIMTKNTIYQGIHKVGQMKWDKPAVQEDITYEHALDMLPEFLNQSYRRNAAPGHKTCVFLSGGVDSGLLAKEMNPNYCFSMDYTDPIFSESDNIKINSQAHHIAMICNRRLFEKYKLKTFEALDDLKAGSCYTNFALTELASKLCTVIYSGAGGDELFDGYAHRYNRPVNEVIRRTDGKLKKYDITHKEYDWEFLKGILIVEDRMSGHFAMETRYPFLDNDLVDFVLSLPTEYKVNKKLLKEVSGLPEQIINSPKKGFSNPYATNDEWTELALTTLKI
jgi:asparagine synthase (glutamine-hydrolysing)